jgi:hypothetical protein
MSVLDLVAAHRKALLTALTAVLIQVVDADTADWIVATVGTILTLLVPNSEDAKRRVYRNHR